MTDQPSRRPGIDTRWFLQRHDAHPKLIRLVVEERAPRRWGCTIAVTSRPNAREMLPILRQALEERMQRADATQGRTFDPVEADG